MKAPREHRISHLVDVGLEEWRKHRSESRCFEAMKKESSRFAYAPPEFEEAWSEMLYFIDA